MDLSSLQVDLDPNDLSGLDPSVVALLQEPCQPAEMRIRIALMKMQQARIRGNSDYAAKIMEHAIEEGARDRQAWTLLDKQIKKLEVEVNNNKSDDDDTKKKEKDKDKEDEDEEDEKDDEDKTKEKEKEGDDNNNKVSSEEVEKLKTQVEKEKNKTKAMQELVMECLQEELGSVRAEQISLQEREARLKARIRSLQEQIPKVVASSAGGDDEDNIKIKELQDTLKEIQENQCTILEYTECVACKEQPATKAVIPCGHLCLCDGCTKSITQLDASNKKCPLCRGQFLSTLHIYTSNL